MTTNIDMNTRIEALHNELATLPDTARAAVIEDVMNVQRGLDLCGLAISTPLENDLKTIIDRVRINANISGIVGTTINVGETFNVNVTVRNCTAHDLKNVKLTARNTQFATVTSPPSFDLGDLANAAPLVSRTFQCKALAATPTPNGPADTLIALSVSANVDLRSFLSEKVQGEIVVS